MDRLEQKLKEYKFLESSNAENEGAHKAIHIPQNAQVIVYKLSVPRDCRRYDLLIELIKRGVIYVFDMFQAETKVCIHSYITLPAEHEEIKGICSLEEGINENLHQSRKALIFKNLIVCIQKLHERGQAHGEIDLANTWIEDMFYVYLGPFNISTESEVFKAGVTFIAPEKILSHDSPLDQKLSDIWALGVIYCCLYFEGFYEFIKFNVQTIEDYLLLLDSLLDLRKMRKVSFLPPQTLTNLSQLIAEIDDSGWKKFSELFDEWRIQLSESQVVSRMFSFDPKTRMDCSSILEFDFFSERPRVPTFRAGSTTSSVSQERPSKKIASKEKRNSTYKDYLQGETVKLRDNTKFSSINPNKTKTISRMDRSRTSSLENHQYSSQKTDAELNRARVPIADRRRRRERKSLNQELKQLLYKDEVRHKKSVQNLRVVVCTSEITFSRGNEFRLISGEYISRLEQEVRIEVPSFSVSVGGRPSSISFDSNFETILTFNDHHTLMAHTLDLVLYGKRSSYEHEVPVGEARIDIRSLIFLFFNGPECDTKMERRTVCIELDGLVIGVVELAIAVSSILEDNLQSTDLRKTLSVEDYTIKQYNENLKNAPKELNSPRSSSISCSRRIPTTTKQIKIQEGKELSPYRKVIRRTPSPSFTNDPPKENREELRSRIQGDFEYYNKQHGFSNTFKSFGSNTANSSKDNSFNDAVRDLKSIVYK